jgi:predicted kinase
MTPPALIIVNGLPGTGKSTLARKLAARLSLPLLSKDLIKETLFDTLGWSDRAWSRRLGVASITLLFKLVEAQLVAGHACIVESNFDPQFDTPRIRALQQRYAFTPVQLLCVTDGPALLARYRARAEAHERHPGHRDDLLLDELAPALLRGRLDPLDIGGALIEIDTTGPAVVDDAALAAQVEDFIHRRDAEAQRI